LNLLNDQVAAYNKRAVPSTRSGVVSASFGFVPDNS
jgi:hypothetical protein